MSEGDNMVAKRAQAAMEFLMTYGWAILVVLIVVGALAYFGVLNPQNLIPEKCVFPTQLSCSDWRIVSGAAGTIQMILTNGGGKDMTLWNVNATSIAIIPTMGCGVTNFPIKSGETKTLLISACNIDATKASTKTKYAIEMNYSYTDSTFYHEMNGELFAKSS